MAKKKPTVAMKKAAAKKKAKKKPAAKKKNVNKSAAIRDFMKKKPSAGPTAVSQALAKKGIKVSPSMVSNVKTTAAKKKKKRGRKPKTAAVDMIAMDALVGAKKLVDQLGGIDKAKAALDAIAKLR
jgi:hypothetical protein